MTLAPLPANLSLGGPIHAVPQGMISPRYPLLSRDLSRPGHHVTTEQKDTTQTQGIHFWAPTLTTALMWPGSTLFHECGHYLTARLAKRPAQINIHNIRVTDIDSLSYPWQMAIYAAGPAFNFLLSGGLIAADIVSDTSPAWSALFKIYAGINILFGATNLIPLEPERRGTLGVIGEIIHTDGWQIRRSWQEYKRSKLQGGGISREDLATPNQAETIPVQDYQDLQQRIDSIQGSEADREKIRGWSVAVVGLEEKYQAMSVAELQGTTQKLRRRLRWGEDLEAVLPEAFAAMREVMARVLGKRPYVEQIAAAFGLHLGRVVEQKTGEGKTLSIALAAYLNALKGPVDVYTFNPYLAMRDADEIGHVMRYMGLTTGTLQGRDEAYLFSEKSGHQRDAFKRNMIRVSRREAYEQADVLYGNNPAFIFDYLHDQDEDHTSKLRTKGRERRYALFDEADAMLLEEANTDFRIVTGNEKSVASYKFLFGMVASWKEGEDFILDRTQRKVTLTEKSLQTLAALEKMDVIFARWKHLRETVKNALKALHLYTINKDYVIFKDEIVIVSEHTGRLEWGRYWEGGLNRFIELKEGLDLRDDYLVSSHMALNNFARLYKKIAGITGTLNGAEAEFNETYRLQTLKIPPHQTSIRHDLSTRIFRTKADKLKAVVAEALAERANGRPVLIGTSHLAESVQIAQMLTEKGEAFNVLNGMQDMEEKEIVAVAGDVGALTIATQLAGRGTDIRPRENALLAGGLHVILTSMASTARVDIQYRGRAARQGEPGSSRQFVSLEDELLVDHGSTGDLAFLEGRLAGTGDAGIDIVDGEAQQVLSQIQSLDTENQRQQRHDLKSKDDLIDPIREAYFSLRGSVLTGGWIQKKVRQLGPSLIDALALMSLDRRQALEDLQRGWSDFVTAYEDLWISSGGQVQAAQVRDLFIDKVVRPFKQGRHIAVRSLSLARQFFKVVKRMFAGTAYARVGGYIQTRVIGDLVASTGKYLGQAARAYKFYKTAHWFYSLALGWKPDVSAIRFCRGYLRSKLGDHEGAINDYLHVINDLWKNQKGSQKNREANIEETLTNLADAFAQRSRACRQKGDRVGSALNSYSAYEIGRATRYKNEWERIKKGLNEQELFVAQTPFLFMRGIYLHHAREKIDTGTTGSHEIAEYYFSRVLAIDPHVVAAHYGRAYARFKLGKTSEAAEDLWQGLKREILDSHQFKNMRLVYSKMTNESLVLKHLEGDLNRIRRLDGGTNMVRENLTDAGSHTRRAERFYRQGEFAKSFAAYADSLCAELLGIKGEIKRQVGYETRLVWKLQPEQFTALCESIKSSSFANADPIGANS